MDLQDLFSRLKFITKIKQGEKINVPHMYTQENNWKTTVVRTLWDTDTRQNAQNFIKETIQNCFEIIFLNLKTNNVAKMELVKSMILDIYLAKRGIMNIKYTYRNDTMFVCALETLELRIDAQMTELRGKYPEFLKDIEVPEEDHME